MFFFFWIIFSVLSCSVFEADDEHEVVSSTTIANQAGVNGTREKSHIETFNCLRSNFTVNEFHFCLYYKFIFNLRNHYYMEKFFLVVYLMVLQLN